MNQVRSRPLQDWLKSAFQKSDNLVFDQLYITLVQSEIPMPFREWKQGDSFLKGLLKRYAGLEMKEARLVDGSGLSRFNHVRPCDLFEVLRAGAKMDLFTKLFPRKEDKKNSLRRWGEDFPKGVRAKTGTMSDICCLGGYTDRGDIFVMMTSNFVAPFSQLKDAIIGFLKTYLS